MLQKILGMIMGRVGGGQKNALMGSVMGMLGGGGGGALAGLGGLGGLLGKFQGAGMQSKVDSWTGSGANQALSAAEVKQALSDQELGALAQDAGVSKRQAASGLAAMLPGMVDQLTPDGNVPDGDGLAGALEGLKGKFDF